jgi:hypothetical protein
MTPALAAASVFVMEPTRATMLPSASQLLYAK